MTDSNSSLLGLQPFVKHRSFTLWRLEAHKDGPTKKPLKVPVHYDGVTHHDLGSDKPGRERPARPAPPLTADEATAWLAHHRAAGTGHDRPGEVGYIGAGFRPAGTGLVCVDLDGCVTADGWAPGAAALMQRFPGALVEQSVSGTGAHVWISVQGEGPGRRGKKRTPFGDVEVYADGQFLALGTVLGGDAAVDHTLAVAGLVAEFWPAVERNDRADPLVLEDVNLPSVVADVRSALATLDPDDRDEWIAAGQALACLGEQGYEIWAEWSATSSRFPGGDGLYKWDEFTGERTDYRAILAKAQRGGWVNPSARQPLPADAAAVFPALTANTAPAAAAAHVSALPPGAMLERPAGRPETTELSFTAAAQGLIAATVASVESALLAPEAGVQIGYDRFKDRISISVGGQPWRPLKDTDYGRLRAAFERRGFKPVPAEAMSTAVAMVAESNTFDSAIQWAEGLAWDGTPRIDAAMARYYSCPDTPYTRAVGAYLFTALAGRCLVPGVKADMAVIMVGLQGAKKTSSIEVLAPEADAFGEVDLSKRDTDLARQMRGKLVMEMAELNGLAGREQKAIRAWISRRIEEWTPKYKEMATSFGRRCVLIGTDNEGEFLDDPTGARRFLPVTVGDVDLAALQRDRDQLWAEGVARFKATGIAWQQAEELARAEHHHYEVVDELETVVRAFLAAPPLPKLGEPILTTPRGDTPIRGIDILTGALSINYANVKKSDQMNLAKIMRKIGYKRDTKWIDGAAAKVWTKVVT